jgi:hypothetical protein
MLLELSRLLDRDSISRFGGDGTDKTAMTFKSWRFRAGLSARAVPMTFRSADVKKKDLS